METTIGPDQVWYRPYNMNGQRYYTYARKNVRFFALDSTLMDRKQLAWIDAALGDAREDWKIRYFHHPLYSNAAPPRIGGRSAHAARADLRQARRQCGLLRPRPRLRADQAAEGHLLLRVGRGGPAEEGQHEELGSDRRVIRPGPELHGSSKSPATEMFFEVRITRRARSSIPA